jgi:hypothetical protein
MYHKVKGRLDFYPKDVTNKHKSQSSWKQTALIRTDCDIDKYYGWFLKRRFNLNLNINLRGSHVTIINDKMDRGLFEEGAKFFHGKEIDFYYGIEPRSNGEHWWLRVWCPESENIRESLGLSKDPYFSLHLTIGHVNEKYLYHSEYILEVCKRFELISSEPRVSFEEMIKQVS